MRRIVALAVLAIVALVAWRVVSWTAPPVPTAATGGAAPAASGTRIEAPTHPLLFGYFYADGRYGDARAEVDPFTNAYVACPACYDTASDWRQPLATALEDAARSRKAIVVVAGPESGWTDLIDRLAPVWSSVRWIEIAHEANIRRPAMDARAAAWRDRESQRGLAPKPLGALLSLCQTWNLLRCSWWNGWTSPAIDYVGLEAYAPLPSEDATPWRLPFPVDYDPAHVTANLTTILDRAELRVPAHRRLYLVMMSYDRNGAWRDPASLLAIQHATYEWSRTRPRVDALLAFAYARPGGVRSSSALRAAHATIGSAIVSKGPAAP